MIGFPLNISLLEKCFLDKLIRPTLYILLEAYLGHLQKT